MDSLVVSTVAGKDMPLELAWSPRVTRVPRMRVRHGGHPKYNRSTDIFEQEAEQRVAEVEAGTRQPWW